MTRCAQIDEQISRTQLASRYMFPHLLGLMFTLYCIENTMVVDRCLLSFQAFVLVLARAGAGQRAVDLTTDDRALQIMPSDCS